MKRALLISAAGLALPAAASAQTPTTTTPATTTTATTPAPATPAPAAPAKASLAIQTVKLGHANTTLVGRKIRVHGTMKPYVSGQKVTVRMYRGHRKVAAKEVTVQSGGTFQLSFVSKISGNFSMKASHRATAKQATATAKLLHLSVLPTHVDGGSAASAVEMLQARLSALGYVVGNKGSFDARTGRAVVAFRKMTGMARNSDATLPVFQALAAGRGAFKVRYPSHGRHIEGDLTHQVLALIDKGGKVDRLYTMSSGKPSTPTVLGHFKVYSRTPGTNSEGMVYSSYFIRGYAVHGYAEVPTYAASHGCLRVPVPDAVPIYNWITFGTPVDVYYR